MDIYFTVIGIRELCKVVCFTLKLTIQNPQKKKKKKKKKKNRTSGIGILKQN